MFKLIARFVMFGQSRLAANTDKPNIDDFWFMTTWDFYSFLDKCNHISRNILFDELIR